MKDDIKIYVWPGAGYWLDEIDLTNYDDNIICIDELCYLCIQQGAGLVIPLSEIPENEIEEYFESDAFIYCDVSMYTESINEETQYFLCIENLKAINIEICS